MVRTLAFILGIAVVVMFIINRIEHNAAAERELEIQRKHNAEVLVLTEAEQRKDSVAKYRIDSLKSTLQVERKRIARVNARADSLKGVLDSQLVALPDIVPAACNPWVEVLNTCKQALASKDSVVKSLTIAFDSATAYSDSLGILYVRSEARGDTLEHSLAVTDSLLDKSQCSIIFGIGCPSRTTSFIGGGVVVLTTLLLTGHVH